MGLEDAAHQAEAVAVHTAAGHSNDAITGLDAAAINQVILIDHSHTKTGEVVATRAVKARHLCGLTPQQGTAALATAIGNALHHFRHRFRRELSGGDVVQEKQGLGAAGHHIVDAHGDQIDADAVVTAVGLGQLQLGADAVGPGDQQGLFDPFRNSAEPAKPAQAADHLRSAGGLNTRADALHKGAPSHHINASGAVVHALDGRSLL